MKTTAAIAATASPPKTRCRRKTAHLHCSSEQAFFGTARDLIELGVSAANLAKAASGIAQTCLYALNQGFGPIAGEALLRTVIRVYLLGENLLLTLDSMARRPANQKWSEQAARARYRQLIRTARKRP